MGEVVELKPKDKAVQPPSDEAKTWTAMDALKSCISDIENGAVPTHIYVAMFIPDGDGQHRIAYAQAGMNNLFETIGILKVHADHHASQWQHETEE